MENNLAKNAMFCATVFAGVAFVYWWINPNISATALSLSTAASSRGPENFSASPEGETLAAVPFIGDDRVLNELNQAFEKDWQQAGLSSAAAAAPLKVARRLSLGLSGSIPALQEIRVLQHQPDDQQVSFWVSHLLRQKRTSDFLAERLARAFVGIEDGPFLLYRRRRFVDWLSNQIFTARPYDEIVADLLSADGLWTDSPAVNFYTRNIIPDVDRDNIPDPVLLAGRTTRAFMAIRLDCLQCHDDFMDEIFLGDAAAPRAGVQADFHQLAAFFSQTRNTFFGIADVQDETVGYRYRLLGDDEQSTLQPVVPYASELLASEGSLREQLTGWLTHRENRPFARSLVNRMWAIMTGNPLVDPVDNIPLNGPFPSALEVLTTDFIAHDFSVHRLIHLIARCDAFQKDSQAQFDITEAHTQKGAVFPMTRLRPDQMAGAVIQATSLKLIDENSHVLNRLKAFDQLREFIRRFGDPGENEFDARGETVTQKLLMFNGKMVSDRLKENPSVTELHWLSPDDETTVETIFLATLSRGPTDLEQQYFLERLKDRSVSKKRQVADIYWSLINSLEFSWNH